MKASNLARLRQPYREGECSTNDRAVSALDLPMWRWKELEALILDDFVEHSPYGIGWWAPHPGTSRRILISYQLYACVASVSANMIEAALHWLEYQDFAERDSERFADIVQIRDGKFDVVLPRPRNALEELSREMVVMHVAGITRALSAALDCLAGVIIGVIAIPAPILTADLGRKIREFFTKIGQGTTDGERVQADFYRRFSEVIASVGPDGWLQWALDFRNMLVHRGRRLESGQFVPKLPQIYGPDGKPVLRSRRLTYLPRNPSMSDVEVWRETPMTSMRDPLEVLVLAEDATQTLGGLLDSTESNDKRNCEASSSTYGSGVEITRRFLRSRPRNGRRAPQQRRRRRFRDMHHARETYLPRLYRPIRSSGGGFSRLPWMMRHGRNGTHSTDVPQHSLANRDFGGGVQVA